MNIIRKLRRAKPAAHVGGLAASFAIPLLALRWAGVDPRGGSAARYCLNAAWLLLSCAAEAAWIVEGVQQSKDFAELTILAPCLVFGVLSVCKTSSFLLRARSGRELLAGLADLRPAVPAAGAAERGTLAAVVADSMKFSNRVVRILFYMNFALILCFNLQPLYIMAAGYLRSGEVHLTLPLPMKYPFDPLSPPNWPIAFVHQTWASAQAVVNLVGADTFFYVSCSHIHMHFRILTHQLQGLTFNAADGAAFRNLIQRHQKLIRFVELLETLYTQSNFLNYMSSSFLICLCGFNFTAISEVGMKLIFLIFLVTTIAQIFLLCYFGDMISTSSSQAAVGLYNSRWYNGTVSERRSVLYVLIRSQKACKLTAAKYTAVNLQTFTAILKNAWSYFALLKSVSNEDRQEYK